MDLTCCVGVDCIASNKVFLHDLVRALEFVSSFLLYRLTFWRRIFFFQILAHSVYKMWVIQKPNKVELWNKRHFEEEKMEIVQHV